jgi:uncharacterized protein
MSTVYHESDLSSQCRDQHRALASLIEELEAVDWYNQRADVTQNEDLKQILLHNRNEEMEHAAMALEWLRREFPEMDEYLKTYLFTTGSITEIEEQQEEGGEGSNPGSSGSLNIGNMKK